MQTEQSQTEAVLPTSIFRVPETIDLPSPVVGASHQPVGKHHHQDTPAPHAEVYQEKTHEELIALMAAWPLEKEGDPDDPDVYEQDENLEIMVLPISLTEFWDAFLADEAPYYYLALETEKD